MKEILRTPSYSGAGFEVTVGTEGPLVRICLLGPTGWRLSKLGLNARMARQVQQAIGEALAALEGEQ
jgi:hypothetical protein